MKPLITTLVAAFLLAILPSIVRAQTLKPVAFFDGSKSEFPESIAIDHRGNLYLSLTSLGRIRKVTPAGVQSDFAQVETPGNRVRGVIFDRLGNLVVAGATGIWKVSLSGTPTLFATVPGHIALNDLAYDHNGSLYVTDSTKYVIWKIDPLGNAAIWSADPLFRAVASTFPNPVGSNGIGFIHNMKTLHVCNTSAGRLLAIDVKADGSAGPARIFAESPLLIGADGLRIDEQDNTYIAVNFQDRIARVSRNGIVSVVVQDDILSAPTSLVFGDKDKPNTLFICNSGGANFGPNPVGEGLLRFDFQRHKHDRHHDGDDDDDD